MSDRHLRRLSEAQVRKVLAAGGMLVDAGGYWRAHRSRDARMKAAGQITRLIAERLQNEGAVHPDTERPDRLIAGLSVSPPRQEIIPPPAKLMMSGRCGKQPSLSALLARNPVSDPAETIRLKAAGQRFLADVRLAGCSADPSAALGRLATLEAAIGIGIFRQLESLLVDALSLAGFVREHGLREPEAPATATNALRALARAYDLT